jgi:hypothetical protein
VNMQRPDEIRAAVGTVEALLKAWATILEEGHLTPQDLQLLLVKSMRRQSDNLRALLDGAGK